MIILRNAVSVFCFAILAYLGTCFQKSYIQKEKFTIRNVFPEEILYFIICFFCYVTVLIAGILFYEIKELTFLQMTENVFLWCGLYLVSWTDFRIKKIPNVVLKVLLLVKAIGITLQILIDHQAWNIAVLSAFLGLLIAGGSVLFCRLISRGQIGAGDVKLYAITGLYMGIAGFVNVMIYSVFIAGIFSSVLLLINFIRKKTKISDTAKITIPMAPFIFLGVSLYFLFL